MKKARKSIIAGLLLLAGAYGAWWAFHLPETKTIGHWLGIVASIVSILAGVISLIFWVLRKPPEKPADSKTAGETVQIKQQKVVVKDNAEVKHLNYVEGDQYNIDKK